MISPYEIAFASLKGITQVFAANILEHIGSEERFFALSERQLAAEMGFDSKVFARDYRDKLLEQANQEADFIASNKISTFYYRNDDYPQRLNDCEDAPLLLYGLGECDLNGAHFVSIVGTRHATPYGKDFVNRLVADLSKMLENVVIVSGLAYGVDAAAHNAALQCEVPTTAVLAHGLSTIYPSANRNIAAKIANGGGLLLSDYQSSMPCHKGNFVARNRIIAGLADCTVVVESDLKGGSLITARLAAGYCRDVFALPGRTSDRYSAGCNRLIANNGASLVTSADDIVNAMRWNARKPEENQPSLFRELSAEEQAIVDYLTSAGEAHINEICVNAGIPIAKLTGILIDMEFDGLVLTYPGSKYRLA